MNDRNPCYVHVHFTLPHDQLVDIARQAYIQYWGCLKRLDRFLTPTYEVIDNLDEQCHTMHLTPTTLGQGLGYLATSGKQGYCEAVARILCGMADGSDGDLLVQAAAFGEVKYG